MTAGLRVDRHDYVAAEYHVAGRLERRGWTVAPYGMSTVPGRLERALVRTGSILRYLPDLVAVRGELVRLVDVKSGSLDRTDWPLPDACARAASVFIAAGLDVVYVWPDLTANPARELVDAWAELEVGTFNGNGTGDPYRWWPRTRVRTFDDVFGSLT